MDKTTAIRKVKLLYRLTASAPEHEAANATSKAQELISKFELAPEEYEEQIEKPIYTQDDLLYESKEVIDWKRIIALATTYKFDCFVIQEEQVASTGDKNYLYFIYGYPDDVTIARHLFNFVCNQIEILITKNCAGRGKLFTSSYSEGVVDTVKINIEYEDYHVEGLVKQAAVEEAKELAPVQALAKTESPKEKPITAAVDIGKNDQRPLDIVAYFRGQADGRNIHIGKITDEFKLEQEIVNIDSIATDVLKKLFN